MTAYARSPAVYKELRTLLGPWFKQHGWRRAPKTDAAWVRTLDAQEELCLIFRCNPWGGGAIGGNSFHVLAQTQPPVEVVGTAVNRQADVALCLLDSELDELRLIQNGINARRPSFEERDEWMREDSPVGEHTRASYKQFKGGEKPYRAGDLVTFGYYSIQDVRLLAGFIERHLPDVVQRFLEGRCAKPAPTPEGQAFNARLARYTGRS